MILDLPLILETRRNHALEHATLHMLARTYKGNMAGHSNPTGFFLLGNFSTQDIWSNATEALERLRGGESGLAIHAGCGTNMATTTLLADFGLAPASRNKVHPLADSAPAHCSCFWINRLQPQPSAWAVASKKYHHRSEHGRRADH